MPQQSTMGTSRKVPTEICRGTEQKADFVPTVKVAVRFRPLSAREKRSGQGKKRSRTTFAATHDSVQQTLGHCSAWKIPGGRSNSVEQIGVPRVPGQTDFTLDHVFDGGDCGSSALGSTTEKVYRVMCDSVVEGVLDGIDGNIFAYGQTGSGKTYTMQGPGATGNEINKKSTNPSENAGDVAVMDKADDGIVQMASKALFSYIGANLEREFLVRTSYIEIYNEKVYDLLTSTSSPETVTVRRDPKTRGGVNISAAEVVVTDHESLVSALYLGNQRRAVGKTDMNPQSSRSHAVFRITLESRELHSLVGKDIEPSGNEGSVTSDDRAVLVSTLNLVDLAGSESVRVSGSSGMRQKEGGKINQSLLALSKVIHALSQPPSERPKFINYRDSKLTRILQPSLSGDARIALLCCASPSVSYVEESRSTLKFGSRAKLVEIHEKKNEIIDDRAVIKRLQRELAAAKKALLQAEQRELKNVAVAEAESAANMRKKLSKLEALMLNPKDRGLRGNQSRNALNEASGSLTATLDPAIWRQAREPHGEKSSLYLSYSVVHAGLGLQTLQFDEGRAVESKGNESLPTTESSHFNGVTSESDILKEALTAKSLANKALASELEELKAKNTILEQESNAYKSELDTALRLLQVEKSNEPDCLLAPRRTFWDLLFGKKQKLLTFCTDFCSVEEASRNSGIYG